MSQVRRGTAAGDEAGFTLVELLVVLVILPLLLGAIAVALIVSLENTGSTSNRLSDSVNAQTTSAYFVRDVQGATWITTKSSLYSSSQIYSSSSPSVCGPTTSPGTLLIAFYRPVSQTGGGTDPQALDVGYWLVANGTGPTQTEQIIRYSCSANNSAGVTSVQITTAPVGSALGSSTAGIIMPSVNITPSRFLTTAAQGWTQTGASAIVTADVSLPGEIFVNTLTNFVGGPTITVTTPFGPVSLTGCTLDSAGVGFQNCVGSTLPLFAGDGVSQGAMTGVSISVNSPASNWIYSLTGAPRVSAQAGSISHTLSVPALLTLGSSGIFVQDHSGALNVTGDVLADLGSLSCSGSAGTSVTGITGSFGATGNTGTSPKVCPSPPAVGGQSAIPDPIAAQLPPCFPDLAAGGTDSSNHNYYKPGKYTSLPPGAVLETGVFEITQSIGGSLTLDPNAPAGDGVLLLLPGKQDIYGSVTGFTCANQAFNNGDGTYGAKLKPGIVLPPLGNGPLPSVFNSNVEMRTMWLWQDRTNTNPIQWTGTGTLTTASTCPAGDPNAGTQAGLAYAPAADLNLGGNAHFDSGSLAVKSVTAFGDNTVVLSGLSSC